MKKGWIWIACFVLCLFLAVPAAWAGEALQGVDAYTFVYRYASWYALLFPDMEVIPGLAVSQDGAGSMSIGAMAVTYDPATQLVSTVSCTMARTDESFINQMIAIAAALSGDEAAAGTFTEDQMAAWIKVCTEAVQRDKDDPYILGAYELYILSTDTEVNLYAIMGTAENAASGDAVPGTAATGAQDTGGQYSTLDVGDEGEQVMALKERLYALGYFTSANYSDKYNDVTAKRVMMFQQANGLTLSGVATPETQALLYSEGAVKNPYPLED